MKSRFQRTIVVALLALAVLPLGAAALLLDEVMAASDRVAAGEAELRRDALERARVAYSELFAARKTAFHEAAARVAERLDGAPDRGAALDRELDRDPALQSARVLDRNGEVQVARSRAITGEWRELTVSEHLPGAGGEAVPSRKREDWNPLRVPNTVELVYVTPRAPFDAFAALSTLQADESGLRLLRGRLGGIFRAVFLGAFLLVVAGATALGLWLARRAARRVAALARATEAVGRGDLEARAPVEGSDELTDLARTFNQMVVELRDSRDRIAYLQKIGAWQEVARRLAHEIKNPLTPIQLAMQQLRDSWSGGDARYGQALAASAEIVAEEIAGLRRLVDEFSAFAKLPRADLQPTDAAAVVDDFVRSYSGFDGKVTLAGPAAPRPISADRLMLKRALHNLVTNALEAGAAHVTIAVESRGDDTAIVVDDDGPGVPPELAARLFDPYVTTKEHGTGLGLAIVKKIALEHGGDVSVESRAPHGARFTLRLRR